MLLLRVQPLRHRRLLDSAQLRQSDRTVFNKLRGDPAWNLAGGYQPNPGGTLFSDPVLRIHLATLGEANASDATGRRLFSEGREACEWRQS